MPSWTPTGEMLDFFEKQVTERFVRYVQIATTADPDSGAIPSSASQWDLLRCLEVELRALEIADASLSEKACVYGTLPANKPGVVPFTLISHVDTSPEVSGKGVKPVLHEKYDGGVIRFPDNPELTLSPDNCPALNGMIGDTVITASGTTLLGADDKAGVAVIMALLATFRKFPEASHGEIRVCFTSDEEIGAGASRIDLTRLSKLCYTMDGGEVGELESESFDAHKAVIDFKGRVTHPGTAFGVMISAIDAAASFVARLPQDQKPERTKDRLGFFYTVSITGSCSDAKVVLIIRDFDPAKNQERIKFLHDLASKMQSEQPGLEVNVQATAQYPNMAQFIRSTPEVVDLAREAILSAGIKPIETPIRGGTDGSILSSFGHPCPNIFTGQHMIHSLTEWTSVGSLVKSGEVLMRLAERYVSETAR
ncbi:MAG: peptidase T [Bdellovibrionota bacterium]